MMGDANLDGKVDIADLSVVLTNYDSISMTWGTGDFDGNGIVDLTDLGWVLTNYDQTLSAAHGSLEVRFPSRAHWRFWLRGYSRRRPGFGGVPTPLTSAEATRGRRTGIPACPIPTDGKACPIPTDRNVCPPSFDEHGARCVKHGRRKPVWCNSPRAAFLAGALIVAAAAAAYSNSFSGPFIFDDLGSIPENPSIRQLWPPWK